jgi:hypothetical protein
VDAVGEPNRQVMILWDNSGSMNDNDYFGYRCQGIRHFISLMGPADEVGLVHYGTRPTMVSPLTSNKSAASAAVNCYSSGDQDERLAFKAVNDELIPKIKPGSTPAIIFATDGWFWKTMIPHEEISRAMNSSVRIYAVLRVTQLTPYGCVNLCQYDAIRNWTNATGGRFYMKLNATPDEVKSYFENAFGSIGLHSWRTPSPPAPMVSLKLTDEIEAVPGSFRCVSGLCRSPEPLGAASILPGNRGLALGWSAPAGEFAQSDAWEVEFRVRPHRWGAGIAVNDPAASVVNYRYRNGSAGPVAAFPPLTLDVEGVPPLVIQTAPQDGEAGVPVETDVNVVFSQEMEPKRTAGSFRIHPVVEGSVMVEGRTLIFSPAKDLAPSTRYKVTIFTDAASAAGIRMDLPYEFEFTTAGVKPARLGHLLESSLLSALLLLAISFPPMIALMRRRRPRRAVRRIPQEPVGAGTSPPAAPSAPPAGPIPDPGPGWVRAGPGPPTGGDAPR